ncbi:MAG: ATP-binding protein, partial [Myxococcota bacterium]
LAPKLTLPLQGVSFIACGAFSGFQSTAHSLSEEERIGFGRSVQPRRSEAIAAKLEEGVLEQTAAFARYGFLPELIGRFSRVVTFDPLDEDTLRAIIEDGVIENYRAEFAQEGIELIVEDSALELVVKRALKRELGARGLRTSLLPHLERAAFETFGGGDATHVRLFAKDGAIEFESR